MHLKLTTASKKQTHPIAMDSKKSNKIRQIVRLQQILKKWRKLANSSKTMSRSSSSRKSIKFLKRTLSLSESSIPKGFLAVCVGEELKRFVIPTEYLDHHAFHILLRQAEEEFGFQQTGVLRIPCDVCVFENILKMVEEKKEVFFMQECCSSENRLTPSHHQQSPMCR
ncbi:auxin-responsive protein SAUR71-like [Corylus avellana]|uniref:auxin-responsive protein SAUR71-like n=1 Tax=Corylus avellana TaxID=13451 RepID=UPI001E2079B7|nr:auxin-responsive protein SAUR71-like [Corylus avellana]